MAVAALAVGAGLAVPAVRARRNAARESAALVELRTVVAAQTAYAAANRGSYDRLECLADPGACLEPDARAQRFLDASLLKPGERGGYVFRLHPGPPPPWQPDEEEIPPSSMTAFAYVATPAPGTGDGRFFCADGTGLVCAGTMPPADAAWNGLCPSRARRCRDRGDGARSRRRRGRTVRPGPAARVGRAPGARGRGAGAGGRRLGRRAAPALRRTNPPGPAARDVRAPGAGGGVERGPPVRRTGLGRRRPLLRPVDVALRASLARRPPLDRLRPEQIKVLQRETQLESQIYDGRLSVVLLLEDLRVGDVLEYAYTLRGQNPVLDGLYSGSFDTEWSVPLRRMRFRLPLSAGTTRGRARPRHLAGRRRARDALRPRVRVGGLGYGGRPRRGSPAARLRALGLGRAQRVGQLAAGRRLGRAPLHEGGRAAAGARGARGALARPAARRGGGGGAAVRTGRHPLPGHRDGRRLAPPARPRAGARPPLRRLQGQGPAVPLDPACAGSRGAPRVRPLVRGPGARRGLADAARVRPRGRARAPRRPHPLARPHRQRAGRSARPHRVRRLRARAGGRRRDHRPLAPPGTAAPAADALGGRPLRDHRRRPAGRLHGGEPLRGRGRRLDAQGPRAPPSRGGRELVPRLLREVVTRRSARPEGSRSATTARPTC